MFQESRKIQLIEELLKVSNETTLSALETILKKSKKAKPQKSTIFDFVGILSDKEARQMKKAIRATCEIPHIDIMHR